MISISDNLWNKIKALFTKKKIKQGRPCLDQKPCLEGILFILKTGAQWHYLPRNFGPSSAVNWTFMLWAKAGTFLKNFCMGCLDL